MIVFRRTRTGTEVAKRHSAEGEDRALGIPVTPGSLVTLPWYYTVFNQIIVPLDRCLRTESPL